LVLIMNSIMNSIMKSVKSKKIEKTEARRA